MQSRPIRIAFLILGVTAVIVSIYFIINSYSLLKIKELLNRSENRNLISTDKKELIQIEENGQAKYSETFFESIKEDPYKELVMQDNDLGDSYVIQNTEAREKFTKEVINNRAQQNHIVEFDNTGLSNDHLFILQGDIVTIDNKTSEKISVERNRTPHDEVSYDEYGEEKVSPKDPAKIDIFSIESGDNLSFGFDFLGEFKLKVSDKILLVNVIKDYENL